MKDGKNNCLAKTSKMLYTCGSLEKGEHQDCDEKIAFHFEESCLLCLRETSAEMKVCKHNL